ncbi:unnamed protein product [Diatraea saccharalis]|uniref:LAS1-like protein n=1 Tax=Diatraea saccharalis TaxID=40085 RepID=A0A9N9WDY1_9NEOP|nr:unnamed protein product [Diatraea saccharalis]
MSKYYHIVPWFNSQEWLQVYENLYITFNKEEALHLMLIWKARCPSLPSGIESTLSLLQVSIQDETESNIANDQLLRLAYSSAVMRFVNHMLDTETAKGSSLYQAARNLGVPDWIIDLRHDTAHSNNLPSIELLREATQIGLDWLGKNYWIKYKECIQDFITGDRSHSFTTETNKIASVIQFCTSLSFCSHSKCKFKSLSEIPDASMRETLVNDAKELFGDQYDFTNLKTVSVQSLVDILNMRSKSLLRNKDVIVLANQALLGQDSLFLSMELSTFMGNDDFEHKKRLSPSYVKCFELLLTFLHSNDMLLDFLLELIEITNKSDNDEHKCLLAALWCSEILKALEKSKCFIEKLKRLGSTDVQTKTNEELRSLYHHWFPNQKVNGLLLDMQKSVPSQLKNIQFLQPIITTYNEYLQFFIKDLLNLVEPKLPNIVTDNICNLSKLISSPNNFQAGTVSTKIYTIEDLTVEEVNKSLGNNKCDSSTGILSTSIEKPMSTSIGIWKQSSGHHDWTKCPIGLVPWQ